MTIQEAIQSGKPFKRETETQWCTVHHGMVYENGASVPRRLSAEAILATNWETKS